MGITQEQQFNYIQYITNMVIEYKIDFKRNTRGIYMTDIAHSSSLEVRELYQFVHELFGRRDNLGTICLYSGEAGLLVDNWFGELNPIYVIKLKTCRERWISLIKEEAAAKARKPFVRYTG